MTINETIMLLLALKVDGPLRYSAVYKAMGGERAWSILNNLRNAGALEHPGYDHWRITEKGRIAEQQAEAIAKLSEQLSRSA